jgi:polyphosphate glucokinase
VILTTLGTGIGTAIVYRGVLIPNSELGHIEVDGHDAEKRAAASVKEKEGLSYKEWIPRLQKYYERLEALMWPDMIVIGGGVSKNSDKFIPKLKLNAEVVPAKLLNTAGIARSTPTSSGSNRLAFTRSRLRLLLGPPLPCTG